MRIAIAGAGAVGRSIAAELCGSGHEVLLIDRSARSIDVDALPDAEWLLADACELASLDSARLEDFDVAIAASGDDKVNLVFSLLAKREFGVDRVIARINDPRDEWLFTEAWGVDEAVSPPRLIAGLVDGGPAARAAGDGSDGGALPPGSAAETDLLEFTLTEGSPHSGTAVAELTPALPDGVVLVAVVRDGRAAPPDPATALRPGDDLVFLGGVDSAEELGSLLDPRPSAG
ncbi:potassium channel family protein [Nocardiopsis potens]|uniref:potassium channel family protein n=1 Tax=Nocardiopsis potens TaxID=1246458 RepID=UPI00034828DE|nr:TrkA family potassium uptake protein [Nocardiopsis potens]